MITRIKVPKAKKAPAGTDKSVMGVIKSGRSLNPKNVPNPITSLKNAMHINENPYPKPTPRASAKEISGRNSLIQYSKKWL